MKVLLDIEDKQAAFVMKLLGNLKFVKTEPLTPYKSEVLLGLKQAVEEMQLISEGKLKGTPIKELLDEL